jgi:hypothetical protein
MSRSSLAMLALVSAGAPVLSTAGDLSLQDFAYAIPITTSAPSSAYRIKIPLDIYRNVAHQDLRDVRVFNARGEAVPYELQDAPPKPLSPSPGASLPVFPLRADARVKLDGLQIRVQSQGAAVNLQTDQQSPEPGPITSYVVDARDLTFPLCAFQLNWPDGAVDFSGNLRVESSDDLAVWHLVKTNSPVLNLRADGALLVRRRVEFPSTKARFWRFTWVGRAAPFALSSVTADAAVGPPEAERVRLTVPSSSRDEKRREFSFDLGARLPVNQVNIGLPEANSVAKLQILSRAHSTDSWRQVAEASFFRVQSAGSERSNDPIAIATNFDRYWLARLTSADSAIGDVAPKLQASWTARELVFLARGGGPFVLAYGNGSAVAASIELGPFLKGVSVQQAELGTPRSAGGPTRLQPGPRVIPWKMLMLWSTLALGISLLGWMAYRLSRELSRAPAPKP